ncbi:MAG: diaminopimelate epimerase [Hyphomicrobiaceae bacterium]
MTTAAAITIARMNGLGNEIVVLDLRGTQRILTADEARRIATMPGWRFDQLMALHDPLAPGTGAYVHIYNTDGSEAGACGNGMRCVVLFDQRAGAVLPQSYETVNGVLAVASEGPPGERISVEMGAPRFGWADIPLSEPFHNTKRIELQIGPIDNPILHSPSVVNVGNPHAIFWVDDVTAYQLDRFGPLLENHPIFPDRANISLAHVTARDAITLRTWERGAGLTRACGSAACAAAVCAVRLKFTDRRVTVTVPGGPLHIEWRESDDQIVMTGPAELERQERIELDRFLSVAPPG